MGVQERERDALREVYEDQRDTAEREGNTENAQEAQRDIDYINTLDNGEEANQQDYNDEGDIDNDIDSDNNDDSLD